MSEELLYTSAPNGLKIGSRDYCTVARTQTMPSALADDLEGLSGYRILFMPRDPNASKNPVVWSHLRIPFEGRLISVLSRIGASGLDYTGRTNKFAHHVALEDNERPVGGPAWLLSQPRFMIPVWDEKVQMIPSGRLAPRGDSTPGVAQAWKSATGDPGWAGVLAESFLSDPKRLIYLIYRPGMDLLPLFAEAEALLPPEKRWEVAFNTFYTNLPSGVSCPWLGIVADSPEIAEARRMTRSLLIDLTQPLGAARGGGLVEQARTGVRSVSRPKPPPPLSIPPIDSLAIEATGRTPRGNQAVGEVRAPRERSGESYPVAHAPPPLDRASLQAPTPPPLRPSRKKASMMPLVLTSSGLGLLLITVGVVVGMRLSAKSEPDLTLANGDPVSSASSGTGSAGPPADPSSSSSTKPVETTNDTSIRARLDPYVNHGRRLFKDSQRWIEHKATRYQDLIKQQAEIEASTRQRKPILVTLPSLRGNGSKQSVVLVNDLPAGREPTIRLVGLEEIEAKGPRIEVEKSKLSEKSGLIKVVYNSGSTLQSPLPVAEFKVEGRSLSFAWDEKPKTLVDSSARILRDCFLDIQFENKPWRRIYFRTPRTETKPLRVGEKRTITWEKEEASLRPLLLLKAQMVPLAGSRPLLPRNATPEISEDGGSAIFRFKSSKGVELVMTLGLKADGIGVLRLGTTFSPDLRKLDQEHTKEIGTKLNQIRKQIDLVDQRLGQAILEKRQENLTEKLAGLKDQEDKLLARDAEVLEAMDMIDKLTAESQMMVVIGFKLGGDEFIAATLGVDGADLK